MGKAVAQTLVVTMTATTDQYVEIAPATDKATAQTLGVAMVGDNQTVTIQPAG